MGATALIDSLIPLSRKDSPYLAPQVFTQCQSSNGDYARRILWSVVGIMSVKSDEEAIEQMNDSEYGLTASIWTRDEAESVANRYN